MITVERQVRHTRRITIVFDEPIQFRSSDEVAKTDELRDGVLTGFTFTDHLPGNEPPLHLDGRGAQPEAHWLKKDGTPSKATVPYETPRRMIAAWCEEHEGWWVEPKPRSWLNDAAKRATDLLAQRATDAVAEEDVLNRRQAEFSRDWDVVTTLSPAQTAELGILDIGLDGVVVLDDVSAGQSAVTATTTTPVVRARPRRTPKNGHAVPKLFTEPYIHSLGIIELRRLASKNKLKNAFKGHSRDALREFLLSLPTEVR